MTTTSIYDQNLNKVAANYTQLSPLSFLKRASNVFPTKLSLVDGNREFTWAETYVRCKCFASVLNNFGVSAGDTVATLLPNVTAMYEAHFAVAMVGGVLNAINTRLNSEIITFILSHSETKVILTDPEYYATLSRAIKELGDKAPIIINVLDTSIESKEMFGDFEYENLLKNGDPEFQWKLPSDEWDAIALGYTSGTTGNPKGVVTHHRGAYLNAASNVIEWEMPAHSVFLHTVPLFHCNGWCFPWTMALIGGANICVRRIDAGEIFALIRKYKVTHYGGAPIVHQIMADAPAELRSGIDHHIKAIIAGAAPSGAIFEQMEKIGIELYHLYGLTETYGPATICVKQPEWADLSVAVRVELNGRQGVRGPLLEGLLVMDPLTMQPVPPDGTTIGEIMFCGNIIMKGYLKNAKATEEAFAGGWFHTGDLAVVYPDGYIKIRDRSKDVIISGGENISSIEIEEILLEHPDVRAAAVVAMSDEKWGEVPVAFVELRDGANVTDSEIDDHCAGRLARFKRPKKYVIGPLVRTSTGKIQKFALRKQLQSQ